MSQQLRRESRERGLLRKRSLSRERKCDERERGGVGSIELRGVRLKNKGVSIAAPNEKTTFLTRY